MSEETSKTNSGATPPRWILKIVTFLHPLLNRLSGGTLGNAISGDEVCFVTMTGARTGKTRVIPLMYVPHGDNVLLVASLGGAPRNPTWYHNVAANPEVSIRHRGTDRAYRARVAQPEEKASLWPICDSAYAPYADYRKRTTRDIPIFICEPVSAGDRASS